VCCCVEKKEKNKRVVERAFLFRNGHKKGDWYIWKSRSMNRLSMSNLSICIALLHFVSTIRIWGSLRGLLLQNSKLKQ
jgi:hypothetical protein